MGFAGMYSECITREKDTNGATREGGKKRGRQGLVSIKLLME